jgi:sirohydrochlorin cobaltochelatase
VSSTIVLLAHGSQDARWRQPLEDLRDRIAGAVDRPRVELAYLQFCPPTIAKTLASCASRGDREVLVVPVFVSGGGHLLRDVPRAIQQAAADQPTLVVRAAGAIGEEPEVLEAMASASLRLARAT